MLVFPILAGRENERRKSYLDRLLKSGEIKTIRFVDLFRFPCAIAESDLEFVVDLFAAYRNYKLEVNHFFPFPGAEKVGYKAPGFYFPEFRALDDEFPTLHAQKNVITQPAPEIGSEVILDYQGCSFDFLQEVLLRFKVRKVKAEKKSADDIIEAPPFEKLIWKNIFS